MSEKTKHVRFSVEWWASLEGVWAAIGVLIALVGLVVTLVLAWPKPPEPQSELANTPTLGISFWQDNKQAYMADGADLSGESDDLTSRTTVHMYPGAFEMRFPEPPEDNGLRINAWKDAANFNVAEDTNTHDIAFYESPFFSGKALADTEKTQAILYLNKGAFSYVGSGRERAADNKQAATYYSRVNDPLPARHTSMPTKAYQPTKESLHPLESWEQNIYLAVWQDGNNNGIIGSDEYEYITLVFDKKRSS